jgi:hypothetical protein
VRRQRADIGDVSRTGCRLEVSQPLGIGAVGMLAVEVAGTLRVELFRVSRAGAVPGAAGLYEAGVEFLPMPAEAPSLHDVVAELDRSDLA